MCALRLRRAAGWRVVFFCLALAVLASARAETTSDALMPCLATLADGTPVYASASFPPSKQINAVFRLPGDSKAKSLQSKWISLAEGEKALAESTIDLKNQKTGWLRLELKEEAKPGKYRIDALLDGKPWKSANVEITPPIAEGLASKPIELLQFVDGFTGTFDVIQTPAKDSPSGPSPGLRPHADGTYRGTVQFAYEAAGEETLRRVVTMNGMLTSDLRVKADPAGMVCMQKAEGENLTDVNPPKCVHPLPPSLTHGLSWKCDTAMDGGPIQLAFFGPLKMTGPEGQAVGYIIYGEEPFQPADAKGTDAGAGPNVQTFERHYIPKFGLVGENRVILVNGKPALRQEVILGNPYYKIFSNPEMKGRLGKVQFWFTDNKLAKDTKVAVHKADAPADAAAVKSGYGPDGFELMPGEYVASINGRRVPIEIKSACVTIPRTGAIHLKAGKETAWSVSDAADKQKLRSGYGEAFIALPPGKYLLEVSGTTEPITIADGQLVEF